MKDVDVVIIGAGSAGLAAARTLQAAGLSFAQLK
ncbi:MULTISPECIES: FAD-binding protein [Mesorhizobium]|nr:MULTISPECIES: FAD-binding protein [Mesorhizobium]